MATRTLTTNYLSRLSNANHDGVSQQICDRLRDFETEPIYRKAQQARQVFRDFNFSTIADTRADTGSDA